MKTYVLVERTVAKYLEVFPSVRNAAQLVPNCRSRRSLLFNQWGDNGLLICWMFVQ